MAECISQLRSITAINRIEMEISQFLLQCNNEGDRNEQYQRVRSVYESSPD